MSQFTEYSIPTDEAYLAQRDANTLVHIDEETARTMTEQKECQYAILIDGNIVFDEEEPQSVEQKECQYAILIDGNIVFDEEEQEDIFHSAIDTMPGAEQENILHSAIATIHSAIATIHSAIDAIVSV